MSLSAFELTKHNARTNTFGWIHETPIVGYGRIIKVIDIQTVVAEYIVRIGLEKEIFTVTLLNLSSSLLEINAWPKVGDRVLLLFVQRHDPRMFFEDSVENSNALGYNFFSGVGILMSSVRGIADTVLKLYENGDESIMSLKSRSRFMGEYNSGYALMFAKAIVDSDDEELISLVFDNGRFFSAVFLPESKVNLDVQCPQTVKIGIDINSENTEAPLDITLGNNADITISSDSGKSEEYAKEVSLKSDKEIDVKGDAITLDSTKKLTVKGGGQSLGKILSDLIDILSNFDGTGSCPDGPITTITGSVAGGKLTTLKSQLGQLINS